MTSMLAILFFIQVTAAGTVNDLADSWKCATPLIQKNLNLKVNSRDLALRIFDECRVQYHKPSAETSGDPVALKEYQDDYYYYVGVFVTNVEKDIERRRRARDIPLAR
ncbi:hypothetical protein [Sphingomonas sp. Leaf17]|uniref:hypothetical protein n=1 Tax=Sphingomonas sp. Leaf17 TaxID=1735683 RepID=UPI0012E2AD7E|nr:hypothetical protein [Sphingomonas sp. Leaf17]